MHPVQEYVFYAFSFVSLYVQVFFLSVFLEKKNQLLIRTEKVELPEYPAVTITIPAYNESHNVKKTVDSLLALEYPKEKIFINIVDDGSTDDTWDVIQIYKDNPQVHLFKKENGGKYTANNVGLMHSYTPFVGCLDADSIVHPQSLARIMTYFFNTEVMAVAPTIITHNPKTIIQKAQAVEYDLSIYTKKMLSFIDAIHVTPGPFSIFRKEVFEKLGPYKHAYNTEDQEIALRMKEAHMRIEHASDAYVYTISPHTVKGLFKQRVRWIYGFIKNAFDYRRLLFKKKYGNIGFITLPSGLISIISIIFLFAVLLYNVFNYFWQKTLQYEAVGLHLDKTFTNKIDWFYIPTQGIMFVTVLVYASVLLSLFIGQKIKTGKVQIRPRIFYFFFVYSIIAPFWLMKAIYNALRSYEVSWTKERDSRGI